MILTVTLNTAIDKTLAVPNFRLGRRHRTVEQTTMPGGKGVNVARVLKTLGAPVIATGLAGGATGTRHRRAAHAALRAVRLRADPRGVAHEHRGDRPHDGRADRDQRARPVGLRAGDRAVRRQAALPRAQGASVCVFAGSLPRNVDVDVYARLIRELKRLGVDTVVDTDGDPLRRAVRAEPDVISPNVLEAEELVGHEFNDEEDHCIAVREMVELGAREAIMTAPDGCYAQHARRPSRAARRALYRVRVRAGVIEPRATVGSGDAFLAGFVAARYNGLRTGGVPASTAWPAARESTQHLGAGLIDPGQVERLLDEVEVERRAGQSAGRGHIISLVA